MDSDAATGVPASIVTADMMCRERRQGTDRVPQSAQFLKIISQALKRYDRYRPSLGFVKGSGSRDLFGCLGRGSSFGRFQHIFIDSFG